MSVLLGASDRSGCAIEIAEHAAPMPTPSIARKAVCPARGKIAGRDLLAQPLGTVASTTLKAMASSLISTARVRDAIRHAIVFCDLVESPRIAKTRRIKELGQNSVSV